MKKQDSNPSERRGREDDGARAEKKRGVRWRVLRVALDWCKLLYAVEVSDQSWAALTSAARTKRAVVQPLGKAPGRELRFTAADHTRYLTLVDESAGVSVVVRAPQADERIPRYAVEVEVEGSALCASNTGLRAVHEIRKAIEKLLYGDQWRRKKARRRALGPSTFPGRWDLSVDVAVHGKRAERWIEGTLFGGGNTSTARKRWSTRARRKGLWQSPAGGLDEHRGGWTLYVGVNPLLSIYEPNRRKQAQDRWPVLRATLRGCGWNGKSPLVRLEWRVQRAWFKDLDVDGRDSRGLTFDDFLGALPSFAVCLWERCLHLSSRAQHGGPRKPSRFWREVKRGLPILMGEEGSWDVRRVRSVRATRDAEADEHAAARALLRLAKRGGASLTEAARRTVLRARRLRR